MALEKDNYSYTASQLIMIVIIAIALLYKKSTT